MTWGLRHRHLQLCERGIAQINHADSKHCLSGVLWHYTTWSFTRLCYQHHVIFQFHSSSLWSCHTLQGSKGWFFSHSLTWVCQHSQLWCDFGKFSWNDTTITHPTVLEDWCLRVHTDFHSCIWCSSFCPLRFLWAKISPSQLLLLFTFWLSFSFLSNLKMISICMIR